MELIDSFYQEGTPPVYTFVFDDYDRQTGRFVMLKMPDGPRWGQGYYMMGEYHPGEANEHLGQRVLKHELGRVVVERMITRLPY
jgi:hypothetical protein